MLTNAPLSKTVDDWLNQLNPEHFDEAWKFIHPQLRLALIQDWALWPGNNNLFSIVSMGRERLSQLLVTDNPSPLPDFNALADRILDRWYVDFKPFKDNRAIDEEGELGHVGDQLVVLVAPSPTRHRLSIVVRDDAEGFGVISFSSYRIPTPGWPPDLAGTPGPGTTVIRSYVNNGKDSQ